MSITKGTARGWGRGIVSIVAAATIGVGVLGACSDSESAQERYCSAGESLRTDLGELRELDLIATGTDGLNDALEEIGSDVDDLRAAAGEAAADDVAELERAVGDVGAAVDALSGELTRDNATAVADALADVVAAAQAVFDTLADC